MPISNDKQNVNNFKVIDQMKELRRKTPAAPGAMAPSGVDKVPDAKIDENYLKEVCNQLYNLTQLYQKSCNNHVFHYKLNDLLDSISNRDKNMNEKNPAMRIIEFEKILAEIQEEEKELKANKKKSHLDADYGRLGIRVFVEKVYDFLCGASILPALYRAAKNWGNYGSFFKPLPREAVKRFEEVLKKYREASQFTPQGDEIEMKELSANKKLR
ncbi:MAG: hypothetical protein K0S27_268 [Gammaproteobacteria bacterium]|jgi:hypothetical protein|nr:hypothetical protein [Gammaproteobacteria bacterium]